MPRRSRGEPRRPRTRQIRKQQRKQIGYAVKDPVSPQGSPHFLMQERKEAEKWQDGSKLAKSDKEEKRKADLARKAENARLLAEEEAAAPPKAKAVPKAASAKKTTKTVKPAGPGAIAAGGGLAAVDTGKDAARPEKPEEPESFEATGIDNALDLLEIVTAKMDKASIGTQAAGIERHPEVCFNPRSTGDEAMY